MKLGDLAMQEHMLGSHYDSLAAELCSVSLKRNEMRTISFLIGIACAIFVKEVY